MDKITEYQYWANLIAKEQLGSIGASEAAELAEWVDVDLQHQRLYERLKLREYAKDILRRQEIDIEAGLRKYYSRYPKQRNRRIFRWTSVAAAVVILLSCGLLFFNREESAKKEVADIYPGTAKAELILSDGSVRQLEEVGKEEIRLGEVVIHNTGTQLEYISKMATLSEGQKPVLTYNELRIPVGGEYQLLMADGTKVWLNSQSRLRFPEKFIGKERCVYLEGEAYFEVAHDSMRPFCVRTKEDINIQVLGTSFNLRAYEDEGTVETVLERGSVRMSGTQGNMVLEPGVRVVYDQKDGKMSQTRVDTELYTSWREGRYVFQEETVDNILHKLSRWYGMTVFFNNEQAKNVMFSGNIRKYDTIKKILEAMEISGGVRFELKGNIIVVYSGR